jgi:hypothetical protein
MKVHEIDGLMAGEYVYTLVSYSGDHGMEERRQLDLVLSIESDNSWSVQFQATVNGVVSRGTLPQMIRLYEL